MALNGVNGAANGAHGEVDGGASPAFKRPRPEGWVVRSSRQARVCVNPVRSCEEQYFKEPMDRRDTSKELIKLSIGELGWCVGGVTWELLHHFA